MYVYKTQEKIKSVIIIMPAKLFKNISALTHIYASMRSPTLCHIVLTYGAKA